MFHSIISEYDVFFAGADFDSVFSGYSWYNENNLSPNGNVNTNTVRKQSGFFSTDPKDFLRQHRAGYK